MASSNELILLIHSDLRREIEKIPNLRDLLENGFSMSLQDLYKKSRDAEFNKGIKYISALIVLKALEVCPISVKESRTVIDYSMELSRMLKLPKNHLFSSIYSLLSINIAACNSIEEIFEWAEVLDHLKNNRVDISTLQGVLQISYSPLIFEISLETTEGRIGEALKYLNKAPKYHLDSTGGLQVIVENALQLIENSGNLATIRPGHVGVQQNRAQLIQEINEIRGIVPGEDEETIERLKVLEMKYNIEERKEGYEITSMDEIILEQVPFKESGNVLDQVYTSIYKARIKRTNQTIAVKRITVKNPDELDNYNNEVNIMRKLSGKSVYFLEFYGSIRENSHNLCILMEYVQGSLMEKMEISKLGPIQILGIAGKLIGGFSFLEEQKISHHDIKPSNILIGENLRPIIIDFGISVFIDVGIPPKTYLNGTPGYRSPEQKKACDTFMANKTKPIQEYDLIKSDVYSLALTFYQMCTGKELNIFTEQENHSNLITSIDDISNITIKEMLKKMTDCVSSRCNFKYLLQFVEDQTRTSFR